MGKEIARPTGGGAKNWLDLAGPGVLRKLCEISDTHIPVSSRLRKHQRNLHGVAHLDCYRLALPTP
jgi:hypothetical protein